jgi:hypothetical protein
VTGNLFTGLTAADSPVSKNTGLLIEGFHFSQSQLEHTCFGWSQQPALPWYEFFIRDFYPGITSAPPRAWA